MKTEKGGGGTSIEKGDEGKCEWEGKGRGRESQQPERRSTGIEIPERNSSRFLLLVAASTRVVSSSPSRLPSLSSLDRILNPFLRSRFGNSSPSAFSPTLSNIHPCLLPVRGGWANGQSVARFFFAARINPLRGYEKGIWRDVFQPQKIPRFISLSGATRHWAVDR